MGLGKMGKNLITGGLGFIGLYLAKKLVDDNEKVVLFQRRTEATGLKFFQNIREKVEVISGDLGNWVQVLDVVKNKDISCIYHLGALRTPLSERCPAAAYVANINGTFNVLEAARLFGVDSVIFMSSGDSFRLDVPRLVSNDAPQRPLTMYGVTKVCGERLGECYHAGFGVNFRGVRGAAIIGLGRFANARDASSSLTAYNYLAIQEAAMGRPYTIYVDKSTTMSLLYVKDLVQGLVDLKKAEDGKLTRRIYNLYGFSATAQELVNTVKKYVPEAQIDFKPDQAMIRVSHRLDDTLARNDWGWAPCYSLDEVVRDVIKEVRANRTLYECW